MDSNDDNEDSSSSGDSETDEFFLKNINKCDTNKNQKNEIFEEKINNKN